MSGFGPKYRTQFCNNCAKIEGLSAIVVKDAQACVCMCEEGMCMCARGCVRVRMCVCVCSYCMCLAEEKKNDDITDRTEGRKKMTILLWTDREKIWRFFYKTSAGKFSPRENFPAEVL